MKSLLSLMFGLMLLSFNANAISLTFKLDIFSSGPSIYACNAGIQHKKYQANVCYLRDNPSQACNPGVCGDGSDCNCVCTGDGLNRNTEGRSRLDFLRASYGVWTDNGIPASFNRSVVKTAGNNMNQIFSQGKFDKQLGSLTFNFGSETYGAEYFLDVCYRAPQINYTGVGGLNYSHDKQVTITDFSVTDETYANLANLHVNAVTLCIDKKGREIQLDDTGWQAFNGRTLIDYRARNTRADLARCFTRYSFKEARRSEGASSFRLHEMQQAQVCTYTSFNEPIAE